MWCVGARRGDGQWDRALAHVFQFMDLAFSPGTERPPPGLSGSCLHSLKQQKLVDFPPGDYEKAAKIKKDADEIFQKPLGSDVSFPQPCEDALVRRFFPQTICHPPHLPHLHLSTLTRSSRKPEHTQAGGAEEVGRHPLVGGGAAQQTPRLLDRGPWDGKR